MEGVILPAKRPGDWIAPLKPLLEPAAQPGPQRKGGCDGSRQHRFTDQGELQTCRALAGLFGETGMPQPQQQQQQLAPLLRQGLAIEAIKLGLSLGHREQGQG